VAIRCTCGETNKDGAQFCNRCGKRLDLRATSNVCTTCGHENPDDSDYCGGCGSQLRPLKVVDPQPDISDTDDPGLSWSRTYGIPGLYQEEVASGPGGAEVRTRFSLLGFREESTYPRWMIGFPTLVVASLLLVLGGLMISTALRLEDTTFVAFGTGIVAFAFLLAFIVYRLYYAPPRKD
jgi:ribosomal protein L40E